MPKFYGDVRKRKTAYEIFQDWTIREFHERRNKVLVWRRLGGAGDILMHRFIFEDLKAANPELEITFACPRQFHDLVQDHPFIDHVADSGKIDANTFRLAYNTSDACMKHETSMISNKTLDLIKDRPDIWANHCGINLRKNPQMHIRLEPEVVEFGYKQLNAAGFKHDRPSILFAPISVAQIRSFTPELITNVATRLKKMGLFVYGTHTTPIEALEKANVPVLCGHSMRNWMGIVNAADYVLTVDSAPFHLAGGLKKPLAALFTFIDGTIRGSYYDFILIQRHRKNGNWPCGPCWNWSSCTRTTADLKPCLTDISPDEVIEGVEKMMTKWNWKSR